VVRPALDAAVMGGLFGRDWMMGGDFARNLGGAAVRGEATYTRVRHADSIWQIVLSIDYNAPLGSGLYLLAEHFYNTNRVNPDEQALVNLAVLDSASPPTNLPDTSEPLTNAQTKKLLNQLASAQFSFLDRFTTFALHQTAFQAGYDLTPLLHANLLTIYDWSGESVAIFPVLSWSVRDDLDLSAGLQLFYGRNPDTSALTTAAGTAKVSRLESEYGGRSNVVFVQLDFFF
jgi:hypothetical protein